MKPQHPYDQTSQTLVSLKFYADTPAYGLSNLQPLQVYYASMSYDFFFQERGKCFDSAQQPCFDSALQPCFDSAPYFDKLNNHLGNVLTVISDKRMLACNADTVTYSYASIISATDYSPFGAPLAGRTFSSESYRFRFNGMENDKGKGFEYMTFGWSIDYAYSKDRYEEYKKDRENRDKNGKLSNNKENKSIKSPRSM